MARGLPAAGSTDPAGEFVVQKPMKVHGVALLPGQPLPHNSPVRSDPRKLDLFCRTRHLRQIAAKSVPEVVEAEEQTSELSAKGKVKLNPLTMSQLVKLAKERGIAHEGLEKVALRRRIRASFA